MSNLFETGTRLALRFNFKGQISIEDLWNLKLEDLNTIAVSLNKEVKAQAEESFITASPKKNVELNYKFEIVKYIIDVKLAERDAAKLQVEKKNKEQQLLALLDQKQQQQLAQLSVEEIQAQLASL